MRIAFLLALLPTLALAQTPAPAPAEMTDEQKIIYALGLLVQRSLTQFDLSADELAIITRALADAGAGRPVVQLAEWGPKIQGLADARAERLTTKQKTAAAAYLATAAAAPGAQRTDSGIVFTELTPGTGASPAATDVVRVHYRGTFIDGNEFDNSYARDMPVEFRLNGVIKCWTEGVQRMKVGGKARLVCPSDLAYGDAGNQAIPGGAALIFEIELLGIVTPAAN